MTTMNMPPPPKLQPQPKEAKKRHYRIFMLIVIGLALTIGFWQVEGSSHSQTVSAIHESDDESVKATTVASVIPESPPSDPLPSGNTSLADQISQVTGETSGTFGIAVKNLTTGETYMDHATDSFTMASTYKVPLVLTSLLAIENGSLAKETKISYWPVLQADELIITRSEEDLAQLLANKLGWTKVNTVAKQFGMKATDYTGNFTTTPLDQITIMEKIYQGQGMSKTVRDQMYGMLSRQQINDRLPKYLPDDVEIAHKTGDLDDLRHDVGIVTAGNQVYVIALMSRDLGTPEEGKEALAKISQIFYHYFTQKR